MRPKPIILTVLDGWGFSLETKGNAIALARKPNYDALLQKFPSTLVHTSGPRVGLPEGQMGNSEVGHLNIGAGRIVYMDITRVDKAIESGAFFKNDLLVGAMQRGRERQLHLLGLVSDGGVHSHNEHIYALLRMARENKVERVFVHCFMDGRDTPPNSGIDFLRALEQKMREYGVGRIASVSGRYYAMDRDNRWERIERAYRAMVHGEAENKFSDPIEAVRRSYEQGVTDEFIVPVVITDDSGASAKPRGSIRDDDAVIFFNFRADRARQTTRALVEPDFDKFADPKRPKNLFFVAMTQYEKTWPWLRYVFGPEKIEHILANVFAEMNMKNLRVAETEKYAHVTYFFNGGVEKPFGGEERILVPSPKVATYDLKPEMSAAGVAEAVVNAVEKGAFDAIVMNFANADMVGHSGKLDAAIKAVESVDECLGRIYGVLRDRQNPGAWIITADHGNAETMIDPKTGGPHTYHTTNPVPFILLTDDDKLKLRPNGALQDIAPTLLGVLGIPQPKEMTGKDLRVQR
ncbi:MAG TPA: 2,3-bisphosphoglycerate-independent phosphoglycerate mutase [Candidatus Acidoferrales bacterium]|nr:2,3-bisphosphoglycerate-independent phosphoglycerate mutase [Candidatus Acidoferrales bacterium]